MVRRLQGGLRQGSGEIHPREHQKRGPGPLIVRGSSQPRKSPSSSSTAVRTGNWLNGGCGKRWPTSDAKTCKSRSSALIRPKTHSVSTLTARRRSWSTAATHSQEETRRLAWVVASTRPKREYRVRHRCLSSDTC